MTYTQKDIIPKIIDVHISNLNNIQKIISRLSNIGISIFSLAITIFSIFIPLIYSLNTTIKIRTILTISLLLITICFFIAHLVNLKNEKLWRLIYSDKTKINVLTLKSNNQIYEILKIDFEKYKKDKSIKLFTVIKSWWSICWFIMITFALITMVIIFFIY